MKLQKDYIGLAQDCPRGHLFKEQQKKTKNKIKKQNELYRET